MLMDVHIAAVLKELMRESELAAVLYSPLTLLVRHSLFSETSFIAFWDVWSLQAVPQTEECLLPGPDV